MQPLVRVQYADRTPAACYGDLEATSEISDWENKTRSFEVKYHVINLYNNDYQAILGRRWLAQVDLDIIMSAGTWQYHHGSLKIIIKKLKYFLKHIRNALMIMVMH
jgi:hypothetical protein